MEHFYTDTGIFLDLGLSSLDYGLELDPNTSLLLLSCTEELLAEKERELSLIEEYEESLSWEVEDKGEEENEETGEDGEYEKEIEKKEKEGKDMLEEQFFV